MSEETKDINNYFPQKLLCFHPRKKQVVTINEILSSFRLSKTFVNLTFDGWEAEGDFNAGKDASADYNFKLSAPAELILPSLEAEIIGYLTKGKKAGWQVEVFLIDMRIKFATVQIRHDDGRLISKEIGTEEKFDDLIANYPQIVGLVETFAWEYAKTNHDVLE